MDLVWKWDRRDVTAFAVRIYDRPMSPAPLEVLDGQLGYLATPEPIRKREG